MSTISINSISFSRLRNAHHIGFHSKMLSEIDSYKYDTLGIDDELYARYKSAISIEQDIVSRSRASELTLKMTQFDLQRDKYFRQISYLLKAAVSGDTTETLTQEILDGIQTKILDVYPASITDNGLQEETAKLRGFIKDMNLYYSEILDTLGIATALTALETANDSFEEAFMDRIREHTASTNTSESRTNCDDAFMQISFYLNSTANVVTTDTALLVKQKLCARAIEEINTLIAYYQSHYYSKATAEDETVVTDPEAEQTPETPAE